MISQVETNAATEVLALLFVSGKVETCAIVELGLGEAKNK